MPNDEDEANRLDLQHHLWLHALKGRLHLAPFPSDIQNALDIGTGTGIWAIDFADMYPDCQVMGTDLSPIQPGWVPPNCQFMVDDADSGDEWDLPQMDYIHSRIITVGIKDWPRYFQRCMKTLKPGGWIEVQEYIIDIYCADGTCPEDDPAFQWSKINSEAMNKNGTDPRAAARFGDYLRDVGFVNVTEVREAWPIGASATEDEHSKILGQSMLYNITEATRSMSAFITRKLGWSKEEVDVLLSKLHTALKDDRRHHCVDMIVHYAQKPLYSSEASVSSKR